MLTIRLVSRDDVQRVDAPTLRDLAAKGIDAGFVWVDLQEPSPGESAVLTELGLPVLVVEDMVEDRHMPKVERVADCLSLTVHGLDVRGGSELSTIELDVALREDMLVTFRHERVASVDALADRLDRGVDGFDRPFDLLHRILDVMNDVFVPIVEHFDSRLDVIEEDVLDDPTEQTRREIYALQRDVIHLRRVVVPQAEVVRRLGRERPPGWRSGDDALVRDLHDHLYRIANLSDSYRQLLDSATESYRAALDDDLNEMLTALTVISAVLLPVSVVAGLWGMNVARVPGDETVDGFWWVMAGCGVLVVLMLLWFLARGWIGRRAERAAARRRSTLSTVLDVPVLGDVLKVPVTTTRAVTRLARWTGRHATRRR